MGGSFAYFIYLFCFPFGQLMILYCRNYETEPIWRSILVGKNKEEKNDNSNKEIGNRVPRAALSPFLIRLINMVHLYIKLRWIDNFVLFYF